MEALAGEALPQDWDDERAVLIGSGRVPLAPTEAEQLGPLAQRLPALG